MKMFPLEWGIHCEFFESNYYGQYDCRRPRARYTDEFAKWLKENNIKVAMHSLEIAYMHGPWIVFKQENDEMFFKLAWLS